jgi:ubiquinone/menaquinone biosynthesis C-methylase UbiE
MNSSRIISGDQLTYHYMRALAYLRPEDVVLDVASGMGLGAKFVAEHVRKVICADIDRKIIEMAQELHKDTLNMDFMCQDVTHMEFEDGTFDAVLSMETFEHMPDAMQYCREINRVLRKDGRFIMSTPQNALGNIAVIAQHVREYSIQEVRSLLTSYFEIDEIIGIKAGVVSFPDDPIGSNMIVLAIKR